jgi:hypothetical protein
MSIIKKIKDKALELAIPHLSSSTIGRWAVGKLTARVGKKLGIQLQAQYREEEQLWHLFAGGNGAPLKINVYLSAAGLTYAAERILPALDKPEEEKKGIIKDTLYQLLTNN